MLVSAGSVSEVKDNGMAADPIETTVTALLPPPLAGSDSGFRRGGSVVSNGELKIELILQ
jgi:hypothetical protein